MKDKIIIKNFGGLKEAEIELRPINVFIGKQASGKSVTAKLLYFSKRIKDDVFEETINGKSKAAIEKRIIENFKNFFPPESWPTGSFQIRYELDGEHFEIVRSVKKVVIGYSTKFRDHFTKCRSIVRGYKKGRDRLPPVGLLPKPRAVQEEYYNYVGETFGQIARNNQIYIPAGRSFFASFASSIFSLLVNNKSIDPFLFEFGSFYEKFRNFVIADLNRESDKKGAAFPATVRQLIREITGSKIIIDEGKIILLHSDNRRVELPFASSGQQETLPLSLMLAFLSKSNYVGGGTSVYIEEPEAHLFPTAQKNIVELMATVFSESKSNLQFVITTHSPYILTTFNNLIYAGFLENRHVEERKLEQVVKKPRRISPHQFGAYLMNDGKVKSLIDPRSRLIKAEALDEVSIELSTEFSRLLDIAHGS